MIPAGQAWIIEVPNEPTDHLWLVLTSEATEDEAVLAMLTDIRNVDSPVVSIPSGIALTEQFRTTKESTIQFARARRTTWPQLDRVLKSPSVRLQGVVVPEWLDRIRLALFESPDTPEDVLRYCEALDWGT